MTISQRKRVFCGRTARALAVGAGLLILPVDLAAAAAKNVVIVHGESPEMIGPRILVDAIRSTVRKESPDPVEFYVETVDTGRYETAFYENRLADLLAEKYRDIKIDLVVAFTAPAVAFVLREHDRLFVGAPVLVGFVEAESFRDKALPPRSAVVYVHADAPGTVALALRTYPSARRLLVVGGTSRFDRGWQAVIREQLRQSQPNVTIDYDVDSPLGTLLRTVAALPPDSIVLYSSMTRDGSDMPTTPVEVLQMLRHASPVPIYGLSTTFLGQGILGGVLIDFERHGADLGRRAVQLLRGEVPPATTTPAVASVDWREMSRFGISDATLPPGTVIAYREPTLWQRYRFLVVLVAFVVAAELALIVALVVLARRRREAQVSLESQLRFQRLLSELSLSLTAAPPDGIASALDAALTRTAAGVGIQSVCRWSSGAGEDDGWSAPEIRSGVPAVFADLRYLPNTVQSKLGGANGAGRSAVAVPLMRDGAPVGALFWVSSGPIDTWPVRLDDLQMVATIVGNVLQRREAEAALWDSGRLKGAILESLPAHVAVLDRDGTIISVNGAWTEFGNANGLTSESTIAAGTSYLAVCRDAVARGCEGADEALTVIEAACRGVHSGRQLEYRCDGPHDERWFLMTAEPLRRPEGGAVVTHSDITARKLNEIALRESEDRFRRLADALPVSIWMADVNGLCTYFNKQWLEMTGRSLEQESGHGWIDGVHPDDRQACMSGYLDAFERRQRFSMDYRIRRFDGEYRWLMDVGEPRYGTDGTFHGYVGGCIDITERREAEQMLRGLNRRLILAQEDERRRIARDLHDHLSQQLALLAIDLQQLAINPPGELDGLVSALQAAWRQTSEIASDVHGISHRLHPSKLEALGLVATIRAHCRDVSRQHLTVHFSEQGAPTGIPPEVALCLFRVVEEALSNVVKHSAAREAYVSLVDTPGELVLRVRDIGCGFMGADEAPRGLGLVSMRERVQALGGALTISSSPGEGTTVEARVPRVRTAPAQFNVDALA